MIILLPEKTRLLPPINPDFGGSGLWFAFLFMECCLFSWLGFEWLLR